MQITKQEEKKFQKCEKEKLKLFKELIKETKDNLSFNETNSWFFKTLDNFGDDIKIFAKCSLSELKGKTEDLKNKEFYY